MKAFLRENRRLLLCTLLALVAGILIGISIGLSMSPYTEKAAETSMLSLLTVGPGTDVRMHLTFSRCAHTEERILERDAYVGLTKEELLSRLPGCTVERFSAERALLSKRVNGACERHYVITQNAEGMCAVERFDGSALDMEQVYRVSFNDETLDGAAARELSEGVVLDSMDEVNAYLESIES